MDLIDNERPKVVEVVHWAASNGDRSENGDYIYGKKRLREIDRRIRFLTKRLEIAEVTDPRSTMATTRSSLAPRWCMSTWHGAGACRDHPGHRRSRQRARGEVTWVAPLPAPC
jgi:transcription elongation factor GreB